MIVHEFSIIASGSDPGADDFETRFFDAGCDDATVSFQKGQIIVDFAREAASLDEAVASAVADVRAGGARVERIEPDPLVSLSDIAARARLSRQAVSLYALGKRSSGFPAPVARVTSDTPLYSWPEVATWLHRRGGLPADAVLAAEIIRAANEAVGRDAPSLHTYLRECRIAVEAQTSEPSAVVEEQANSTFRP